MSVRRGKGKKDQPFNEKIEDQKETETNVTTTDHIPGSVSSPPTTSLAQTKTLPGTSTKARRLSVKPTFTVPEPEELTSNISAPSPLTSVLGHLSDDAEEEQFDEPGLFNAILTATTTPIDQIKKRE